MRHFPNILTVARAAAVVPVVLLLAAPDLTWWALAAFVLAALTDAADGILARRLSATTSLGAFLDPLADKVLVLGTLAALLAQDAVAAWAVLVIVGREALAVVLRSAGALRGLALEASAFGKSKTVAQALAVCTLLGARAAPGEAIAAAASVALVVAVALTLASGADLAVRIPVLSSRARAAADAR